MNRAFIGLGSNVGDRLHYLHRAVKALAEFPETAVKKVSSVYATEPVGMKEQAEFLNAVMEIETVLDVRRLYTLLKEIERALGRTYRQQWGPREIDLDILYYNDVVLNESELKIPHPEIPNRRFVLAPLAEIAPECIDPIRKQTILEMLQGLNDQSAVRQTTFHLGKDVE